jgi:HD-like signal output (HDOD) protein
VVVKRGDYGLDEIVAIVERDPVLSADLLRAANSACFGPTRGVTTLAQAVTRIGAQQVERIALTSALSTLARAPGRLQALQKGVWQGAVGGAMICQELARMRGLQTGDAFLCGLLHDFGWVVGIAALEELLDEHPEVPAQPAPRWAAMIDSLHVELGLVTAERWRLPELFSEVISLHHTWDRPKSSHESKVELVIAADRICQMMLELPCVAPEDMEGMGLERNEREALARLIPELPALVASFEAQSEGKPQQTKILPPTELPEGMRAIAAPVRVLQPRRGSYQLAALGPRSFRISGRAAFAANELVQAEIDLGQHKVSLWAKVEKLTPQGDSTAVDCRPFALNGETRQALDALYHSLAAA